MNTREETNKLIKTAQEVGKVSGKIEYRRKWFCPLCNKLAQPRDDVDLLEYDMCQDCHIILSEIASGR
jgi:hypothetical protein